MTLGARSRFRYRFYACLIAGLAVVAADGCASAGSARAADARGDVRGRRPAATPAPSEAPDSFMWHGEIAEVSGAIAVGRHGSTCEVTIAQLEGANHDCRVEVRCGRPSVVLYGGGMNGYAQCDGSGNTTLAADDSATDGDPELHVDLASGAVIVAGVDDDGGRWRVLIEAVGVSAAPEPTVSETADTEAAPPDSSDERAPDTASTWTPDLGGFALGQRLTEARATCGLLGGVWEAARDVGACTGLRRGAVQLVLSAPPLHAYAAFAGFGSVTLHASAGRVSTITLGTSGTPGRDSTFALVRRALNDALGEGNADEPTNADDAAAGVRAESLTVRWAPRPGLRVALLGAVMLVGRTSGTLTTVVTIADTDVSDRE